jgi:hypothetical protein
MKMIAHDEAAIELFQPVGGGGFGDEPIAGRVIIVELGGGGLGMETDQAAVAALDNLKNLGGGAIEPVGGGEENSDFGFAASRTRRCYAACCDSSLSLIR